MVSICVQATRNTGEIDFVSAGSMLYVQIERHFAGGHASPAFSDARGLRFDNNVDQHAVYSYIRGRAPNDRA